MPVYNGESAALYGRVSTADQQNSNDAQNARMLDYARFKRLSVPPDLMFFDADTSGSIPIAERDKGADLLAALKAKKARHLIVPKLDRLGRNAVDVQSTWLYLTRELGVVVHIIDLGGDSFSSDNAFSKFMVGLLSLCAEWELERIRTRINEVKEHKSSRGEQIGGVPFGKRLVPSGRFGKSRNPDGTPKPTMLLEDDPEEIEWLKKIITWRSHGEQNSGPWSFGQIANELNRLKVPTKKKGTWNRATVFNLFQNQHVKKLAEELSTSTTHESNTEILRC